MAQVAQHEDAADGLRLVAESLFDLVTLIDHRQRITLAFGRVFDQFGISAAGVVGRTFGEVLGPEAAPTHLEVFAAVLAGETRTFEWQFRFHGKPVWFQTIASPVCDASGAVVGVTAVSRDITLLQEAQERLRHSRDFALSLLDRFPVPVWLMDAAGHVYYCNRPWLDYTGRQPDEKREPRWLSEIHPGDQERCSQVFERAFEARLPCAREYRLRRYDGEYGWFLEQSRPFHTPNGEFAGYVAVCTDLSVRKQAEDVLYKYQLLADLSPDVVLFVRTRDGRVIEANRAAELTYGYDRETLLNMTIQQLRDPKADAFLQAKMMEKDHGGLRYEATHRRKDGSIFPVEVTSVKGRIGGEQILFALLRDITVRQRQEKAQALLHQLNERILRNEPLDGLLQFACDEVVRIFEAPLVWIGSKEPDGTLRVLSRAGAATAYLNQATIRWDDTPEGQGPSGRSVRTRKPQHGNLRQDPTTLPWRAHAQTFGLKYSLVLPLLAEDQVLGTIAIYTEKNQPFDEGTVQELTSFAGQVAFSMLSARQLERIRLQSAALAVAAPAVVISDKTGVIEWVNSAFTDLTGYPADEVVGKTPRILKSGHHTEAFYRQLWETVLAGRVWRGTMYNRRKDGSSYIEEMTITPVAEESGEIGHFVAIKQDVTAQKHREERTIHLVSHDFLTGLLNRHGLIERLIWALASGRRPRTSAVVLVDLDHFKQINRTVGHPVGDQFLISIGRVIRGAVPHGADVARLGSDEFGILLEGVKADQVREVAESIRAALADCDFHWEANHFTLTTSIGAIMTETGLTAEDNLAMAEVALAAAKQAGGDQIAFRERLAPGDEKLAAQRWVTRIRQALATGHVVVRYQPMIGLQAEQPERLEALVRLEESDGTLVPPDLFLPVAEHFGLIAEVDRYVLSQALTEAGRRPDCRVHVNLSGHTLADEGLVTFIRERLAAEGVTPDRLCLELPEQVALMDLAHVQDRLRDLKDLGCLVALDDFGSGFASFAYLRTLPVDIVKIDGAHTRNLDADPANRAMAKGIIEIAHALGMTVVAKQVERQEDAAVLRSLGAEFGQGFLWGRPEAI